MDAPIVRRLLHHDRLIVVGALLAAVVAAWAWLLAGAGTMQEMGGMLMPMSSGPWTPGHAAIMLGMWASMMAAMMLPSAAPMILLYGTIARGREQRGQPVAASAYFVLGYVVLWAGFSVAATALQYALERVALLSSMMQTTSVGLAGGLLIAAGVYQWTPLKQACLRRCRSPLEFVLTQWREGVRGALAMGLRHGAYCLGCCWMLMLLLFVGGVMNLAWIAALALFVLVEKLAPAGHWIGRAAGAALVAWGVFVLHAAVLPGDGM